jgi:hypothetical protein
MLWKLFKREDYSKGKTCFKKTVSTRDFLLIKSVDIITKKCVFTKRYRHFLFILHIRFKSFSEIIPVPWTDGRF